VNFLTWATQRCWRDKRLLRCWCDMHDWRVRRHWRHLCHWRLRRRGQDWHHWCKRRRWQNWFARRRWFSRMCPRLRDVNSLTEAGLLSRASAKHIGWLRRLDWRCWIVNADGCYWIVNADWRYWIVNADWRFWIVNLNWFDGWTWFCTPGRQWTRKN